MAFLKFHMKLMSLVLIGLGPFIVVAQTTSTKSFYEKIDKLTLEQKASQLMIIGFAQTQYNIRLKNRLTKINPGGVILFQRNVKNPSQLSMLNENLQNFSLEKNGLPLFIMIDQEGGQVSRIKTRPPTPSALAMGTTNNPTLVKNIGLETGKILNLMGVNMNLAPVLDLSNPLKKNFIGNRSFGRNPNTVSIMSNAFANGLKEAGIISTAKHFPGHGGINQDSHKRTPVKLGTIDALLKNDLVPFQKYFINSHLSATMVAHITYPDIDPSRLPATYSKKILTDLIRDRMGYNGLVITDDLEMEGAATIGDVGERAIRAIEAGADMVMVAWSRKKQLKVKQALVKAIASGRLSTNRVNDSLRRILQTKSEMASNAAKHILTNKEKRILLKSSLNRLKSLTTEVSRINYGIQKRKFSFVPDGDSKKTTAFVFSNFRNFYNAFRGEYKGRSKFQRISRKSDGDVNYLLRKIPNAIGIYYASGNVSARNLMKISKSIRKRIVVVNTTYDGNVPNAEDFGAVINLSTPNPTAGKWLAETLNEIHPPTRIPTGEKHSFRRKNINKKKKATYGS